MYELNLAGVTFVVGLVLWFRPLLGLLVFQRYRGPPNTRAERRLREQIVVLAAIGCIVAASASATLLSLWDPW